MSEAPKGSCDRRAFETDEQVWLVDDFEQWRIVSRYLLQQSLCPNDVTWLGSAENQPYLFTFRTASDLQKGIESGQEDVNRSSESMPRVSRGFIDMAKLVACHSDPSRWTSLYEALWRMTRGEQNLLELATDPLTMKLSRMQHQVSRDCHKMKAFVRFKKVADDPETFVAFHQPDHNIVRVVAPFFSRRFKGMRWTILTPGGSASWDGEQLTYGLGVCRTESPRDDELVALWKDYYRSIFNPARIKIKAMKKEMPVRYWKQLPEATEISELLAEAPQRVGQMLDRAQRIHRSAAAFIPVEATLPQLAAAVHVCAGCDLCENGTRAVPGSGPSNASLMIVGEQPGDFEEQLGRPFVGPAGQLLHELLRESLLDPSAIYMTNVVKHFNHEQRGKQRLHKRPSARHESACLPWLRREVELLRPQVVLALGVTAMQALLGRELKITELISQRPGPLVSWASPLTYVSWHPAAILRVDSSLASFRRDQLLATLRTIASGLLGTGKR